MKHRWSVWSQQNCYLSQNIKMKKFASGRVEGETSHRLGGASAASPPIYFPPPTFYGLVVPNIHKKRQKLQGRWPWRASCSRSINSPLNLSLNYSNRTTLLSSPISTANTNSLVLIRQFFKQTVILMGGFNFPNQLSRLYSQLKPVFLIYI